MTTTSIALPRKELQRNAHTDAEDGWDLFLDDTLLASGFRSELEARMELDLLAWYWLFGEAALSPDRPLSDEALGIALAVFNRLFTTIKVQEKARTALQTIIKPGIYTINADGSLSVMASSGKGKVAYAVKAHTMLCDGKAYQVTMACECRDFYTRVHEHGGVCKHVAARLLLSLAQQGVGYLKHLRDLLDCPSDSQSDSPPSTALPIHLEADSEPAEAVTDEQALAFLELDATDLVAALFLATRAATPVELRAEHGSLRLVAGITDLTFACLDGNAAAAVQLDGEAITALYDQLRPVAKTAGVLALFIEASDGTVLLDGRGDTSFSATAQGRPIISPCPVAEPQPDVTPVAAPAPADHPRTLDALFELFTLLETHEPEWYLKRHYRIAHEALQSAGRLAA